MAYIGTREDSKYKNHLKVTDNLTCIKLKNVLSKLTSSNAEKNVAKLFSLLPLIAWNMIMNNDT